MEEDEEEGPSVEFPLPGRASISASAREEEEDLPAKRRRKRKKQFSPSFSPCRSRKREKSAPRSKWQHAQSARGVGGKELTASRPPVVPPSPRQRAASAADPERGRRGGSPAPRAAEKRRESIAGAAGSIPVLCAPQMPARPNAELSQGETVMIDRFSSALSQFLSEFRKQNVLSPGIPVLSGPHRSSPVEAAAVVWSDDRHAMSAGSPVVPDPVPLAVSAQAAGNLISAPDSQVRESMPCFCLH